MESVIVISFCVVSLRNFIVPVYSADEGRPANNNNGSRSYTAWNDDKKIELMKIFYETINGRGSHRDRIKERWDKLYGLEKNQSARNLYERAKEWIDRGKAEKLLTDEQRQFTKFRRQRNKIIWTPQMREDVLKFYNESNKEEWGQLTRMKNLWDSKYPNHTNITGKHLMTLLRYLLMKKGEQLPTRRLSLTNELKEDLVRCYYLAPEGKGKRLKMMRELFIKRHPELSNATYNELRCQLSHFQNRNPEIDKRISEEVSALDTVHHSWEPGETSGLNWGQSRSIPTFQSHGTPRVSKEYSKPNRSRELGGTSGSKPEESTSIPQFPSLDFPRQSELYFDPSRDNAWIDHMIQEASFSNLHAFSNEGTSYHNIHSDDISEHSESELYRHQSDRKKKGSSRKEQPALQQHHSNQEQNKSSKGKQPASQ